MSFGNGAPNVTLSACRVMWLHVATYRQLGACGAMDNASDYESEDCRFESCQAQIFFLQYLYQESVFNLVILLLFKSVVLAYICTRFWNFAAAVVVAIA